MSESKDVLLMMAKRVLAIPFSSSMLDNICGLAWLPVQGRLDVVGRMGIRRARGDGEAPPGTDTPDVAPAHAALPTRGGSERTRPPDPQSEQMGARPTVDIKKKASTIDRIEQNRNLHESRKKTWYNQAERGEGGWGEKKHAR